MSFSQFAAWGNSPLFSHSVLAVGPSFSWKSGETPYIPEWRGCNSFQANSSYTQKGWSLNEEELFSMTWLKLNVIKSLESTARDGWKYSKWTVRKQKLLILIIGYMLSNWNVVGMWMGRMVVSSLVSLHIATMFSCFNMLWVLNYGQGSLVKLNVLTWLLD